MSFSLSLSGQDYLDPGKPVDIRVNDLIERMTLVEKIAQMGNKAPAIPRLKVPSYDYWSEALHGVAFQGIATVFPQAIALGSTWDPELMEHITTVISTEARAKANTGRRKYLTFWSPTINLLRDPRWGREEEGYSEDPYLTGRMGIAFVKGMQGYDPRYLKTVSTVKHFVANNSEFNRHYGSSDVDERDLHEYYLQAFKACVKEGNVQSLMGAYNSLNGIPCCAHSVLLTDILRHEWGFNGFVVSDCGAIWDIYGNHQYVSTAEKASAIAVKAGTDINCGETYQQALGKAIQQKLIKITDLDQALKRAFRARFLLGEFDPPEMVPYNSIPASKIDAPEHRKLSLLAAKKAIVLLKNENNILPLDIDSLHSIAVIGPNAAQCIFGGYSGSSSFRVNPLDGIREKTHSSITAYVRLEAENYASQSGIQTETCSEGGENIGYINKGDWISFKRLDFSIGSKSFTARVASLSTGGTIEIYLDDVNGKKVGECRVPVTNNWQIWVTITCRTKSITGIHDIYLKFTGPGSGYLFNINWIQFNPLDITYRPATPQDITIHYAEGCKIKGTDTSGFSHAKKIAKKSDIALLVLGTDLSIATEGKDRKDIGLPGVQEELAREIYKVNPRTIVVLVTGSRLGINWINDHVPGIICAWYGGQSQGTAIADVLFGDFNPGAKLTTTWYKSTTDLPDIADYAIRLKNRTYWYYTDEILYPFGHGLSYTRFTYSNLDISPGVVEVNDRLSVNVTITNSGERPGDEVVQLYIHNRDLKEKLPVKKLAGFKRITLAPGETKNIHFAIIANGETMGYWEAGKDRFTLNNTKIDIMVGSSSRDIRLNGVLQVGKVDK